MTTYPRDFLLEHVQSLSEFIDPIAAVFYGYDPNYTIGQDAACVKLKWKNLQEQGTPDERPEYDATRDVYTSNFVGWRQGVLTLLCESYDAEREAGDILDGILLRMRRNSSKDARASAKVGLVSMGNVLDVSQQVDNRMVNMATVDVFFQVLNIDSQDGAETWIETVNTNNVIPMATPNAFAGEANGSASASASFNVG